MHALYVHCLYNYWFCYENGKEKLFTSLFRRVQIQNKGNKNESELESATELELKSELESHTE